MKKNLALEYMRILGMLAVLGIHVGSSIVEAPDFSRILFFMYEVFSRYGIPIFFFISGFGLFAKIDVQQTFDYVRFLKRNFVRLLLTYMFWSGLYFFHYSNFAGCALSYVLQEYFYALLLGYGGFHLYFVLLLIIFYLLMPLWVRLLRLINSRPGIYLPCMIVFQLLFNYFMLRYFVYHTGIKFFDNIAIFQLNLIVFYYLSTFMLGAYIGNNQTSSMTWLVNKRWCVYTAFWLALANLIYATYELFYIKHYSMVQVTFTLHQLSTPGFLYCTAFILASFVFLSRCNLNNMPAKGVFKFLAGASNIVYFSHPLFLYYLTEEYKLHRPIGELDSILIYVAVLCATLLTAAVWRLVSRILPKGK